MRCVKTVPISKRTDKQLGGLSDIASNPSMSKTKLGESFKVRYSHEPGAMILSYYFSTPPSYTRLSRFFKLPPIPLSCRADYKKPLHMCGRRNCIPLSERAKKAGI